ncbi:site-specific integrase [Candidatus Bathyarchaeota archaeon]|nr:site-specific integrase [Candidatus Bathyarchaeota archaeon]
MNQSLKEAAYNYWLQGLNVVLLREKKPLHEWRRWQTERQSEGDFEALPWSEADGFALICGSRLSNGLHFATVDFDVKMLAKKQERRAGKKLAAYLQLLKETGMRAGEATRLKWTDIDEERRIIILNSPEKGSNPRIWKITAKLMNMLNALPRKSQYIFGNPNPRAIRALFCNTRKKLAEKLQNPRMLKISFHTFRHWKATTLYHQTKNLLLVKEFLGHAEVDNTLLYIQIEQALYGQSNDDEFVVYGTSDKEEIKKLLAVGFDYVCQKDDILYFGKRK